jgi:hypothetical protein
MARRPRRGSVFGSRFTYLLSSGIACAFEWRKTHQEAIQKYEVQLALFAMAGTEVTEEKRTELRRQWGFPPEPSHRDVFMNGEGSALFVAE